MEASTIEANEKLRRVNTRIDQSICHFSHWLMKHKRDIDVTHYIARHRIGESDLYDGEINFYLTKMTVSVRVRVQLTTNERRKKNIKRNYTWSLHCPPIFCVCLTRVRVSASIRSSVLCFFFITFFWVITQRIATHISHNLEMSDEKIHEIFLVSTSPLLTRSSHPNFWRFSHNSRRHLALCTLSNRSAMQIHCDNFTERHIT